MRAKILGIRRRAINMVLAIDIGNSNITLGGFVGDSLNFCAHISTDTNATSDDYACRILNLLSLYGVDKNGISGAIIASVVPQLTTVLWDTVKLIAKTDALIIGPGIKTGIGILCDTPSTVGADLIAAAVATHFIYGDPSLIIDMGTATKMTVVNKNGAFIGTSIMPGVMMSIDALSDRTAQLPKVSPKAPLCVVAKNTADCIKSGIIYGTASMIDGMIERINDELGEELNVYITGGYAPLVAPYCKHEMTSDENLVLRGLNIIYKKNA